MAEKFGGVSAMTRRIRGYYKILSTPRQSGSPNYKGLYRNEPYPPSNYREQNQFMSLWERYSHDGPGLTKELSLDELKALAKLATANTGDCHEVIYYSESNKCPYEAEYYGIDVAGVWFSMLGSLFKDPKEPADGVYNLWDVIISHFKMGLNANGLFEKLEDAISFRTVLNDLLAINSSYIENENWRIIHVFRVK